MPTKMGWTFIETRENFGQTPFLPPPVTHIGIDPRLAGYKSTPLTTEPWLLLNF